VRVPAGALDPAPRLPACANDQGSWCAQVWGWTHNDLLARVSDQVVGAALAIVLIVVLALVVRAVLHHAINRMVQGAANGARLSATLGRRCARWRRRCCPTGARSGPGRSARCSARSPR
jgi:small conductance mechanosensitive channel